MGHERAKHTTTPELTGIDEPLRLRFCIVHKVIRGVGVRVGVQRLLGRVRVVVVVVMIVVLIVIMSVVVVCVDVLVCVEGVSEVRRHVELLSRGGVGTRRQGGTLHGHGHGHGHGQGHGRVAEGQVWRVEVERGLRADACGTEPLWVWVGKRDAVGSRDGGGRGL